MTINHPSFVGFETLFDKIDRMAHQQNPGYPPHNILKFDDNDEDFVLELALAGYRQEDIEIVLEKDTLTVQTTKDYGSNVDGVVFLHKGVSTKKFRKTFTIADNIEVIGASMTNGMLQIELHKFVPEEDKPRYISISNDVDKKTESIYLTE